MKPKQTEGRTNYLLPAEMRRLVMAAAPHLKPLLIFLVGTGARMGEALELQWRDVDLVGARATFWGTRINAEGQKRRGTKGGKRRVARLPPVVVQALAALPHRDGTVFRWQTKTPVRPGMAPPRVSEYADKDRQGGGQIKTAWNGALRRAGLDVNDGYPRLTPHDLRHTWASWHYAVHKDLLLLKKEGGWSSVTLVERYAHLLPAGQVVEIAAFWRVGYEVDGHGVDTGPAADVVTN